MYAGQWLKGGLSNAGKQIKLRSVQWGRFCKFWSLRTLVLGKPPSHKYWYRKSYVLCVWQSMTGLTLLYVNSNFIFCFNLYHLLIFHELFKHIFSPIQGSVLASIQPCYWSAENPMLCDHGSGWWDFETSLSLREAVKCGMSGGVQQGSVQSRRWLYCAKITFKKLQDSQVWSSIVLCPSHLSLSCSVMHIYFLRKEDDHVCYFSTLLCF